MKEEFKDDTFLAKWLNGQLSEEELANFEAREDFDIYKKIADTTADFELPQTDKSSGWADLQERIKGDKQPAKIRALNTWLRLTAAASILLLIGYFSIFRAGTIASYATLAAEQKTITLPEGSVVRLNAVTQISYNPESFSKQRVLELDGEAFFEVKEGTDFIVKTPNGAVKVLGTSFNVRSRASVVEVVCYTGRVGFSQDDFQQMETLAKGERILVESAEIRQKHTIDLEGNSPDWTNGSSRFIQANLTEVIQELERQFGVTIEYPGELNKLPPYNGGFPHNNLETALNIVFSSVGYQFKINGKVVVVSK